MATLFVTCAKCIEWRPKSCDCKCSHCDGEWNLRCKGGCSGGKVQCQTCQGAGVIRKRYFLYFSVIEQCPTCPNDGQVYHSWDRQAGTCTESGLRGRGWFKCKVCDGKGDSKCQYCCDSRGRRSDCPICKGAGEYLDCDCEGVRRFEIGHLLTRLEIKPNEHTYDRERNFLWEPGNRVLSTSDMIVDLKSLVRPDRAT